MAFAPFLWFHKVSDWTNSGQVKGYSIRREAAYDGHITESDVDAAAALDLKRATAALTEEEEVNLNGKWFYQVTVNWHFSPTEGMQATGKWLLYLLQT